ncbi:MAG: ABC transporter permease subunit [Chloroflexia bacterium]|nr:ABC transporter permease subunit [Chloroflexia bacterium]
MSSEQPVRTPQQPYGEVFDRGYQHYQGERLGRSYAIRALIIYSIKRGLGIKKKWTAKIIPFILYSIAYLPAIVITAIISFFPGETGLGYSSLYGFLDFVILIFAASVAPEMLCDDRRENVLPLYFSRPISRLDYLLSKISAMGILMATLVFGPALMLFAGRALTDDNPASWLVNNLDEVLRIAAYGVLLSAFYAAIGLTIATFTTRKGVASAIMIVGVIILSGFANGLYFAIDDPATNPVVFLSPFDVLDGARAWVFGTGLGGGSMAGDADLPGFSYGLVIAAIVGVAAAVMHRRYVSEE